MDVKGWVIWIPLNHYNFVSIIAHHLDNVGSPPANIIDTPEELLRDTS